MAPTAASLDGFTVHRARLFGDVRRRGELEAGLGALRVADVTRHEEILVIPHLRAAEPIRTGMPASLFAARLSDQLRQVAAEAIIDPPHGVPEGRAFRFTSHDRYAAWLIYNWLRPASLQTRDFLGVLLKGQSVEQWQRRVILNDGVRIVRLVRALAAQGRAVEWVAHLSPGGCQTIIHSLGRTYGFAPAPFQAASADDVGEAVLAATRQRDTQFALPKPRRAAPQSEPAQWLKLSRLTKSVALQLTEQHSELSELSEERQAILSVALALAEHPGIGASLAGEGWHSLARVVVGLPEAPLYRRSETTIAPGLRKIGTNRRAATAGHEEPTADDRLAEHSKTEGDTDTPIPAAPQEPEWTPPVAKAKDPKSSPDLTNTTPAIDIETTHYVAIPQFHTRFGGMMFIVNILLALRLYPDFTAPLGQRLAPSPFWLLAQLGSHIFGRSFRRDPLCSLLKQHGHPGRLPTKWQVQPHWLAGFPKVIALRPVFDGQCLVQKDRRGFIYSAQKAKPYSRKAIASRSGGGGVARRKLPADPDERWIACLAKFIRFRIAHAAPGLDISALCIPATIDLTDDSLDLNFTLAKLPLAIRLAGLDRNPGWLPSEGRNIAFHFS